MERLVRIVQDLSKVRSLPEIISIVRTAARQATGADGATFVLRDEGYCFYVDEDAIGPLWKGKRFPLTACISGWAMLNKRSVAIPDIFQDSRIPIEAYRPTFVKSLAMVPIRIEDPIGAIGNYWAHEHQATEQELEILQAIADTTSVAIENVQLYASLQERVRELESAHHIKDEFLMMISHELRTPLNSILGWSELLVSSEMDDTELIRKSAEAIHRNSQAQSRVIDSLLDASSIVLGKFEVDRHEMDFIPLVKDEIAKAHAQAEQKDIGLHFKNLLPTAWMQGDAERLRQVVKSLLENAIKYTPRGGSIHAELSIEGPSVCFRVRDSGIGIDLKGRPDIFNRFSQAGSYLTRDHGGLGLGLTIAKNIVEAHQGQISAISGGPNQGSEFVFKLPLKTHEAAQTNTNASKMNIGPST